MNTRRHRVRFEQHEGSWRVYTIKVIDGVDEEVQLGEAIHQKGSRKWSVMRSGMDAVMIIDADDIDEARAKLERLLDEQASSAPDEGGAA